jgi:hypothetical protein
MSRILEGHITAAERKLAGLTRARLEARVAMLFREQPHLLSFIAALSEFGVSQSGIQFLYRLLTVCHQAMKESGGRWPVISERRTQAALRLLRAVENQDRSLRATQLAAVSNDDTAHTERFLRSYVGKSVDGFLTRSRGQEQMGCLAEAALQIVDSIAAEAENDWVSAGVIEGERAWRMLH